MSLYRLLITPQTHVRATQGDRILFQIPVVCPQNCGQLRKKTAKDEKGCPHSLAADGLRRVKRLIKYNQYKEDLFAEAHRLRFDLPAVGAGITFYIPMPKKWNKEKRNNYHMTWHMREPDLDNLLKAFFDGLKKQDCGIAHLSGLAKYWVDSQKGWIEVKDDWIITDTGVEVHAKKLNTSI